MNGEVGVKTRGGGDGRSSRVVVVPLRQGLRDGSGLQVERFWFQLDRRRPGGVASLVHRRCFRRSFGLCSVMETVSAGSRTHLHRASDVIRKYNSAADRHISRDSGRKNRNVLLGKRRIGAVIISKDSRWWRGDGMSNEVSRRPSRAARCRAVKTTIGLGRGRVDERGDVQVVDYLLLSTRGGEREADRNCTRQVPLGQEREDWMV